MKNIYSNPTPLRQKFIEYLTLNRKAERTVHCYVSFIYSLAKFCMQEKSRSCKRKAEGKRILTEGNKANGEDRKRYFHFGLWRKKRKFVLTPARVSGASPKRIVAMPSAIAQASGLLSVFCTDLFGVTPGIIYPIFENTILLSCKD